MTDKQNKSTFNNISVISKRFGVPWTKSKTEYQRTHQPVTSSSHTKLNQVHFVEDKTGSECQQKPSTCRKFFTQSWTKYTLSRTKPDQSTKRNHQPVASSSHKAEPSTLCPGLESKSDILIETSHKFTTQSWTKYTVVDKTGSENQEKPSTCRKLFTQSWTKYTFSWTRIKVKNSNRDKPQVHHKSWTKYTLSWTKPVRSTKRNHQAVASSSHKVKPSTLCPGLESKSKL